MCADVGVDLNTVMEICDDTNYELKQRMKLDCRLMRFLQKVSTIAPDEFSQLLSAGTQNRQFAPPKGDEPRYVHVLRSAPRRSQTYQLHQ